MRLHNAYFNLKTKPNETRQRLGRMEILSNFFRNPLPNFNA
jgi:hypothetical protein